MTLCSEITFKLSFYESLYFWIIRNFVPTMGCFFGLAFKKYGMPLPAIIIGEFVINIIFFGFIALGAPTAIQDVITGLALLIIITVTTKATKGEIVK